MQIAIQLEDFELARKIAMLVQEGDEERSELLLLVAIAVSKKSSVTEALTFINGGSVRNVRVEDILQNMPTKIDQKLKQEIKASMADFQSKTESLRQ